VQQEEESVGIGELHKVGVGTLVQIAGFDPARGTGVCRQPHFINVSIELQYIIALIFADAQRNICVQIFYAGGAAVIQFTVNEDGLVRDISRSGPGSQHDRKHFSKSGVAEKIPKETIVGGDTGYQGIQDDLPNHSVITPFKKTKGHPLTEEEKLLNREFSRGRIIRVVAE